MGGTSYLRSSYLHKQPVSRNITPLIVIFQITWRKSSTAWPERVGKSHTVVRCFIKSNYNIKSLDGFLFFWVFKLGGARSPWQWPSVFRGSAFANSNTRSFINRRVFDLILKTCPELTDIRTPISQLVSDPSNTGRTHTENVIFPYRMSRWFSFVLVSLEFKENCWV